MYFSFKIKVPTFIESIVVYFLLRYRKKHFGCAFRKIKLNKDKFAIVDPDDYQKLSQHHWQLFENESNKCYAARLENRKIVHMHRIIMNAPAGKIVDHKDRNGLNNTKQNLRFATPSQNCCNRTRSKKGTSKYRGVSFKKKERKWHACICYNGIDKHLGTFDNEEDAARAYDEAAKIYHGEFAVLNFSQVASKPLAKTDPQESQPQKYLAPSFTGGFLPQIIVAATAIWSKLVVQIINVIVSRRLVSSKSLMDEDGLVSSKSLMDEDGSPWRRWIYRVVALGEDGRNGL